MTPLQSCELEISRFFNKYYKFCGSSEPDDLRDLLSSIYSANDKMEKAGLGNLKHDKRFIALKAFRNFATHESELLNSSKALSFEAVTTVRAEVRIMCLIPIETLKYITKNLRSKYTKKCINNRVIHYNKYIDIYPTIFNFAVSLYFRSIEKKLIIEGEGFDSISRSIQFEKENNFPHYIDGKNYNA